jgi:hypothetical protein
MRCASSARGERQEWLQRGIALIVCGFIHLCIYGNLLSLSFMNRIDIVDKRTSQALNRSGEGKRGESGLEFDFKFTWRPWRRAGRSPPRKGSLSKILR